MIILFLGILLAQIINVLIRWQQYRTKEYFYYLTYLSLFFIFLVILFSNTFLPEKYHYESWQANFVSRPVSLLIYFFYNEFIISFLSLRQENPSLYRVIRWYSTFILVSFVSQIVVQYIFRTRIDVLDDLHGIFSIVIFFVVIYFIYKLWKMRTKLTAYILKGTIALTIGTFITSIINIFMLQGKLAYGEYYFYPLLLGIALEIYFFNSGLFFKTSSNEKELIATQQLLISELNENEKLLIEKHDIRNKIAQDLHDDIGATLSGIAMHSHLTTFKMESDKKDEAVTSLKLIEKSASEMVNKLNDIVWAVNPDHDEIGKMFKRLEEYALTMAAAKEIEVITNIDEKVSRQKLSMEIRKNIFLIGKEAINNAVKYSQANQLKLEVVCFEELCNIIISDNGIGFSDSNIGNGNGLLNMKRRAKEINVLLSIKSVEKKGTTITIEYKNTSTGDV